MAGQPRTFTIKKRHERSKPETMFEAFVFYKNKFIFPFSQRKSLASPTMKFSTTNIVLALAASATMQVAAQDPVLMVVVTLYKPNGSAPSNSTSELQAINVGMNTIKPVLDEVVTEVVAEQVPTRNLRSSIEREMASCDPCPGFAESYPGCWVNGIWKRQCRRGLTIHQDLSDEAVAELSEEDRRRHLYIVGLCSEAKSGVSVAIEEAQDMGVVPIPESGTFIEKCLYEYA
jgi:hypothetical protein